MSTVTKMDVPATLWRNGSDGEPQVHLTLPAGERAWVRIPRSSRKAYALCVAALDAAADAAATEAGSGLEARMDDFEWYKVEFPSEPEA